METSLQIKLIGLRVRGVGLRYLLFDRSGKPVVKLSAPVNGNGKGGDEKKPAQKPAN